MSANQSFGARPEAACASPLAPAALFQLFFQPGRFFSRMDGLGRFPQALLVAWFCGLALSVGKIDERMARAEAGHPSAAWHQIAPWLLESWPHYWLLVLAAGTLGAVALWYFGGWIFRVRLNICGVVCADKRAARVANVYQEFVYASAVLMTAVVQTGLFADYKSTWEAMPPWAGLPLVFAFWSCWTSYCAAVSGFAARRGKALVWFLMLPALSYAVTFGLAMAVLLPTTGASA